MKKTLIAAAALAVSAGAMADVTITGVFDTTFRISEYDNGAGVSKTTTAVGRDGSGTSGLYFSAKEDLGDGLTALGFYELDVSPWEAAVTFNGGEKFAGLQGSFGTLRIGSPNTPSLAAQGIRAGLFGTKDGGRGVAGGQTATNNGGAASFLSTTTLFGVALTRFDGSVRYDTPNFSGFSAAVNFVPESDDGELAANLGTGYVAGDAVAARGLLTDIGLFYKAGPINAALTIYSEGEDLGGWTTGAATAAQATASAKTTQTTFGLQFNAGFAIFGAGLNQTKLEGGINGIDTEASGFNVLATVPLSEALTLGANVQASTIKDNLADTEVKYSQVAVGVNYALSKLTSTYARYVSATSDAAGDPSASTILVGLMTKF